MAKVEKLKGERDMVESRDRHLFDASKVPGEEDPVQRIEDWVEAVERSKFRMRRIERRGQSTLEVNFRRQARVPAVT